MSFDYEFEKIRRGIIAGHYVDTQDVLEVIQARSRRMSSRDIDTLKGLAKQYYK